MTVAGHGPDNEKGRLVRIAMRLIEERGEEVSRLALANGAGIPRARVEALFPEESDLFDAIVENWFADYVTIMEDVVAADLPPNRPSLSAAHVLRTTPSTGHPSRYAQRKCPAS